MYSEGGGGKREDGKVELFHITKNDCRGTAEEAQKLLSLFFSLV